MAENNIGLQPKQEYSVNKTNLLAIHRPLHIPLYEFTHKAPFSISLPRVEKRDSERNSLSIDFSHDYLLKEWFFSKNSNPPQEGFPRRWPHNNYYTRWRDFTEKFEFGEMGSVLLEGTGISHLVKVESKNKSIQIPDKFAVQRRVSEGTVDYYLGISEFPEGLILPEPEVGKKWMIICFLRRQTPPDTPFRQSTESLIEDTSTAGMHMLYAIKSYQEVQSRSLTSQ